MKSLSVEAGRSQGRLGPLSVAIFVAASVALLLQAGDPFWLDELHTVWCARGSFAELTSRATLGNQSPPYFLAEALAGRLFGYGPHAMRALSTLAGAAAAVVAFRYVARSSRSTALAATVACSPLLWPTLSFYFVEARPYALVYLAATILWTKLTEALTPDPASEDDETTRTAQRHLRRARLGWVAALAAAVWLHPTALLLIAPTILALAADLLRTESRKRYSPFARALDLALVALLCVPSTPLWLTLYERRGAWAAFIRSPDVRHWASDFELVPFVAIPGLALAGAVVAESFRRRDEGAGTRRSLATSATRAALFAAAFAIPLLLASAATWSDAARLYHFRYLIGAVAALPLFTAAAIETIRWRPVQAIAAAIFIATLFWISGGARTLVTSGRIVPPSRQENWQALADRLAGAPGAPIVIDGGIIESKRWHDSDRPEEREYLAFPLLAFPELAHRRIESISYDRRAAAALSETTRQQAYDVGRLYAVVRGDASAPEKMNQRLRADGVRFDADPTIESFGQLWLLTYAYEPPDS